MHLNHTTNDQDTIHTCQSQAERSFRRSECLYFLLALYRHLPISIVEKLPCHQIPMLMYNHQLLSK